MEKLSKLDTKVNVETWEVSDTSSSSPKESSLSVVLQEARRKANEPKIGIFQDFKGWCRQNCPSWRFYITIYAFLALLASIVNIVALAIAIGIHGIDENGRIPLSEGDCSKMKTSYVFARLFISGMAMYMLSSSVYVMVTSNINLTLYTKELTGSQYCIGPPARDEIDREHAQGRWLDVGVASIRNLLRIRKKRAFYFVALGVTSPLLQLFYNAVLFPTYSTNSYSAIIAREGFVRAQNLTFKYPGNFQQSATMAASFNGVVHHLHQKARKGKLEKLGQKDCIAAYAVPLQFSRRNLVVITEGSTAKGSSSDVINAYHAGIPSAASREEPEPYSWLCNDIKMKSRDQCLYHLDHIQTASSDLQWTVSGGQKAKYCLSERAEEHCKLSFSLHMAVIVIVTCLFKTIIMFAVAFTVDESPLTTTGDAIVSFMTNPDPHTKGMCMASKDSIKKSRGHWTTEVPQLYDLKRRRWISSIKTITFTTLLLMVLSVCFAVSLYCTINETMTVNDFFFNLGFGSINHHFFLGWHQNRLVGMFTSFCIANVGHVIFGCIYILYSNIFYCMIFSDEWARYATHRKGLRVSRSPVGFQRTIYFLLMPHKQAIPILAFSCSIHFCISQALFYVNVEAYKDMLGKVLRQPELDYSATGFSPTANLALISCSLIMIGYLLFHATNQYDSGMPLTSTCSAAISAACHPAIDEDEDFDKLPVQWGVVEIRDGHGHCTFSAKDVKMPDTITKYT